MDKHAPEPLCQKCGEDRNSMVTATRDARIVVWHCSVCGHSWRPEPRKIDTQGNSITGP